MYIYIYIYAFIKNNRRRYTSDYILFKVIHFIESCSAHKWNAYVAENLLKIKSGKIRHGFNSDKQTQIL